jgi:hypothetical protein
MSAAPRPETATELAARLTAERTGNPFLLFRDGDRVQQLVVLGADHDRVTLGRDGANDVPLSWDAEVSRVHAELIRVGGVWVVADQGMSRNGTFLNHRAVRERQRLSDGDILRLGQTLVAVAIPAADGSETTMRSPTATAPVAGDELSPMQRRILMELCRPMVSRRPGALPASNQEIAEAVSLSVQGVKSQLRNLSERFGCADLPQNRKRLALAERAVRLGLGGSVES